MAKKAMLGRVIAVFTGFALLYALTLILRAAMPAAPRHPAVLSPDDGAVLVIAHRGGKQLWPENTLLAFRKATELGVDMLEMDVWATADGVPVVIHDETVERTTDGQGRVGEFTLVQLKRLDAGFRWLPHGESGDYPFRGQGISIPTLEEVFEAFPAMPMVIEIKQTAPSIVTPVGELIQRYDRFSRTIIASFDSQVLREFRNRYPEAASSAGAGEARRFIIPHLIFLGHLVPLDFQLFQLPLRIGPLSLITPRFLRAVRARGLDVHVWTINEPETMRRLISLGVDGIMTDRPDLLLEELGLAPGDRVD